MSSPTLSPKDRPIDGQQDGNAPRVTDIPSDSPKSEITDVPAKKFNRDARFWAIIATLCIIGLLSALENTVVTTAGPTLISELDLKENYIWITNVFFLTAAAVQPLFGQLANIFGRRWVTMSIVALFTLGSAVAGGASSGAMLIAGRAVQGLGSGGINMIIEVIIADLVPLRERGNYFAFVLIVYSVGTMIGPWVGGAVVESTTWRWVFYINLPIGGLAMLMIFLFLHVKHDKEMTLVQKLRRIDYIGNALIVASTIAILYALTYGGATYPWSSWRVIVPLVLGLVGLIAFVGFEATDLAAEPVIPPRLFTNRTSVTVFGATFLNSLLLYWTLFFLPVYFQAVLGSSPSRSGVQILPAIVVGIPGAAVAVVLLARFGRYKPLHLIGFGITTIGMGLFTRLDRHTTTAQWAIYEMVGALGSGFVLNTLLPAVQAQFDEKDQAATTAAWSFVRSLGSIWGVAIPAAIFNSRFAELAWRIGDGTVRAQLTSGNSYQYANADFIASFPEPLRGEIVGVYSDALQRLWQFSVLFSGLSFLLILFEKEVELRNELDTEYGMETKKTSGMGKGIGIPAVVTSEV